MLSIVSLKASLTLLVKLTIATRWQLTILQAGLPIPDCDRGCHTSAIDCSLPVLHQKSLRNTAASL